MSARARLSTLIILVTAAWGCTLLIEGVPVSASWLRSFSVVQIIVAGGLLLFDRLLWRVRFISRALGRPVIAGTWKGVVKSSYREQPIPCYLEVEQTYSRIEIRLLSANGKSHTVACRWGSASGGACVYYIYQLITDTLNRVKDPVRFGGGVLEVVGTPPVEVRGPYWTDGLTVGQICFDEWSKRLYRGYGAAERDSYERKV